MHFDIHFGDWFSYDSFGFCFLEDYISEMVKT